MHHQHLHRLRDAPPSTATPPCPLPRRPFRQGGWDLVVLVSGAGVALELVVLVLLQRCVLRPQATAEGRGGRGNGTPPTYVAINSQVGYGSTQSERAQPAGLARARDDGQ